MVRFLWFSLAICWCCIPTYASPLARTSAGFEFAVDEPSDAESPEVISVRYLPTDCSGYLKTKGHRTSGIYKIHPKFLRNPVLVYCDMETDGGGWTVIQRRGDYGEPREDFYRGWNDYKEGFGNLEREFWLGNDNLFALTNQDDVALRIDLADWENERRYALFDRFVVRSDQELYKAVLGKFGGTVNDSMSMNVNDTAFSTKDRDNDVLSTKNCAQHRKGGWWYTGCAQSNPNGLYYLRGPYKSSDHDGIEWISWKKEWYSLKSTEMKLRPTSFAA